MNNAGDSNVRTGKAKRVRDVGWEPVEGIIVTCDKRVGNGPIFLSGC